MAEVDLRVLLNNVRLSFPKIAEPQAQKADDGSDKIPTYNCEFIMSENHPNWAQYHKIAQHVAQQKWVDKAQGVLQMLNMQSKNRGWGWGQEKIQKSTMQPYPSYIGNVFIKCKSERPPQIFDASGNLIPFENSMAWKELARKMYGGCRVNAVVKPWGWNNKQGGMGISNDFLSIQFLADDEPFGEGMTDASDLMGATPQGLQQSNTPGGAGNAPSWSPPGVPSAPGMPQVPGGSQMPPPPSWGQPQAKPKPNWMR